jgi:hypothetical protein
VQYSTVTGTAWQVTKLSSFTLLPGRYYLVQEAKGSAGTTDLPAPDAVGTIAMSVSAGKVALVNTTNALSGACPAGASVVDLVGYGAGTNCSETAVAPTPSNTTADFRAGDGCIDTGDNSKDFAARPPDPRNSSSPVKLCVAASQAKSFADFSEPDFSQKETGAGPFNPEGTAPAFFASVSFFELPLFDDFNARRPPEGSTRLRRDASASGPPDKHGVRPRPRGAWP